MHSSTPTIIQIITDESAYHDYFLALDAYEMMEKQLTWVIRGDVEDLKWRGKISQVSGKQVEHVFEVQYFTTAYAIAVRHYRDLTGQKDWFPASNDMQFATTIVNSSSNIKPLANNLHTVKSAYFRRGADKDPLSPNDPLIKYLDDAASEFQHLVDLYIKTNPNTLDFRQQLLDVLTKTPWYTGGWKDNLCQGGRIKFATNFKDADAEQYYADNIAPFDNNVFAPNAWGKVKKTK